MAELDELFGEGSGQPRPRYALLISLLVSGLLLALLGMLCTTAPGGVLVLIGWLVLEKEIDRIDSGYLPVDCRSSLEFWRVFAYAAVAIVLILFLCQGVLFWLGFYDGLWEYMLILLASATR